MAVYLFVAVAAFVITRFQGVEIVGEYTHLAVAALFLVMGVSLAKGNLRHYGVALGGLIEPPTDDRPAGPLGLWDLGRAIVAASPSALRELGVAVLVAAVIFPIFAVGFYYWYEPIRAFHFTLPADFTALALAQLLVVALPEEAFFRGFLQTSLTDLESSRVRVLGVALAPKAWLLQAALFALIHVVVEPYPSRLAVFFPALLFGWLRQWRGGIGAAMVLESE